MLKLTKTKSSQWMGNGFGNDNAEWVVVGYENIAVKKLGFYWFAVDLNEYTMFNNRQVNKKIARSETKKGLLEILADKI